MLSKHWPDIIRFGVPLLHREEAVAGRFNKSEAQALDIVRYNIHEIGRIEKYRRNVLLELGVELRIQLSAARRVGGGAQLLKQLVSGRVGVLRDVKAGVEPLA